MTTPAPADGPAIASPAGTLVRFGAGRAPESRTTVTIDAWEGPLGLLLSLIEARRLDVMTVPLGAVAEAYLDALAGLEEDRIGNISAFVAVASQLILIKSRELLPRRAAGIDGPTGGFDDGAEDPENALRERLLVYKAFRDAGAALQAGAIERVGTFRREPAVAFATAITGAQPPRAVPEEPSVLVRALAGLVEIVPPPDLPPEVVARTITMADRAAIIRAALAAAPTIVLQELLRGVRDRVVVAVTFLALLELMKRREVVVEQAEPFGPIVARRLEREPGAAAMDAAVMDEDWA